MSDETLPVCRVCGEPGYWPCAPQWCPQPPQLAHDIASSRRQAAPASEVRFDAGDRVPAPVWFAEDGVFSVRPRQQLTRDPSSPTGVRVVTQDDGETLRRIKRNTVRRLANDPVDPAPGHYVAGDQNCGAVGRCVLVSRDGTDLPNLGLVPENWRQLVRAVDIATSPRTVPLEPESAGGRDLVGSSDLHYSRVAGMFGLDEDDSSWNSPADVARQGYTYLGPAESFLTTQKED